MQDVARGVARAGLVAKGVMYALLSVLALRVAAGDHASADSHGALRSVASGPWGSFLLSALAVGFLAYAAWQVVAYRRADEWHTRAAAATRAVVWGGLAVLATRVVVHAGGRGNQEETLTARLLDLPFGPWLVAGAGVVVIVVGVALLRDLRGHRFLRDLRPLPVGTRSLVKGVTVVGIASKAGVFALVGAFLVRAAVRHQPRSGVGLDGALARLSREPYGTWLLVVVALGLAAYAVWCGVRARYENVDFSDG